MTCSTSRRDGMGSKLQQGKRRVKESRKEIKTLIHCRHWL